jgi:hypothetical protein
MTRGYRQPLPLLVRLERNSIWDGDCHLWTGTTCRSGYGQMMTGSRTDGTRRLQMTHRVAFREQHELEIPDDMHVDHICRVRRCWAKAHLQLLTPAENCSVVTEELAVVRRLNLMKARTVRWMPR